MVAETQTANYGVRAYPLRCPSVGYGRRQMYQQHVRTDMVDTTNNTQSRQPVAPRFRRTPEERAECKKRRIVSEERARASRKIDEEEALNNRMRRLSWAREQFGDATFRTRDFTWRVFHVQKAEAVAIASCRAYDSYSMVRPRAMKELAWLVIHGDVEKVTPPDGRVDSSVGGRLWKAVESNG